MAALTGAGIQPAQLALTPISRDHGGVVVGATSDQAFTVGNSGGDASGTASSSQAISVLLAN